MFKKVLVAIDEGGPAARAVEVAAELAGQIGARLAAIHVVDSSRAFAAELAVVDEREMAQLRRTGAALLSAACARIPAELSVQQFLVEGEPAEAIRSTAQEWGADVIVMGSDSCGRLAHFLLGSTADSVIRRASCPVMTVRMNAVTRTAEVNRIAASA